MICTLKVTVKLESDTIFGSGYSIPGGVDIAVKVDSKGYPYLSGSTLRGLLREETENLLDWEKNGDKDAELQAMFGSPDKDSNLWNGSPSPRRVSVSGLTLANQNKHGNDHLTQRTFTQIDPDTGTVKKGSLRVASCIRKGSKFIGTVLCDEGDAERLTQALRCIKYIGTNRTRGLGRVSIQVVKEKGKNENQAIAAEDGKEILSYSLELQEPMRLTDLGTSYSMYLESREVISGSAMRGAVMGILSREKPEEFAKYKGELLTQVDFHDIILKKQDVEKPAIPTPKGYYAAKDGSKFYSLLSSEEQEVVPETKRAALGQFCAIRDDGKLLTWSPATAAETRINLKEQNDAESGGMFQTECMNPGQKGSGSIRFHCSKEAKALVLEALSHRIALGAAIHSGFGLCKLENFVWTDICPAAAAYGYGESDPIQGEKLYLLALSPLAIQDDCGEPCGFSEEILSGLLGVTVEKIKCATSVGEVHGFNATWGCRLPIEMVYQRGSLFLLHCEQAPAFDWLRKLEREGIGARRTEGFGQVLFLKALPKEKADGAEAQTRKKSAEAERRSKRMRWLLDHLDLVDNKLSPSQRGDVQVWCEQQKNKTLQQAKEELNKLFEKAKEKSAVFEDKYSQMQKTVNTILDSKDIPADSVKERMELISDLFDYGRKENG